MLELFMRARWNPHINCYFLIHMFVSTFDNECILKLTYIIIYPDARFSLLPILSWNKVGNKQKKYLLLSKRNVDNKKLSDENIFFILFKDFSNILKQNSYINVAYSSISCWKYSFWSFFKNRFTLCRHHCHRNH